MLGSFSPLWVLVGFLAISNVGSAVFLMGRTAIKVSNARLDQAQKDDVACNAKIDDFAAVVNGAADNEVNAANEAAALIPMLKDRQQLEARCKTSPYCRKPVPGGSADANGAD